VNKFNFGGILSPGATDDGVGSVGTLTVQSNLSFASGSGLKVEAGGVGADLLRVVAGGGASGNLEIGPGAQLHVQPSGNLVYGTKYVIATYAGTITGIFEQVSDGFVVDYSVAKQISVMVVPEPAAACGAALAGMLVLRRRR